MTKDKSSSMDCKCGVKPAQHWHNKETGDIEGFFTTIGTENADVLISEEDEMLMAEKILFPEKRDKRSN